MTTGSDTVEGEGKDITQDSPVDDKTDQHLIGVSWQIATKWHVQQSPRSGERGCSFGGFCSALVTSCR